MMALDYAPARRGLRRSRRSLRRDPFVVAAALLCAVLFLVLLAHAAYGGTSVGGETIRVQPGQTLWSIVGDRYPDDDVRLRVDQIIDANHLQGASVDAGETLVLPAP
jgi:hypothetical protein